MLYFILAAVIAIVFIGGALTYVFGPGSKTIDNGRYGTKSVPGVKGPAAAIAAGSLAMLVLLTLLCSATTVGARSVGIQTAFGRYQDTLSSGFQFTAPWSSVEEFSTNIQPLDLEGKDNNVPLNFEGGGRGTLDATVRWRIDAPAAENLWKKYKTFDNVRDQLVRSSAKDSFRVIVGTYAPNEARAGENLRPITEAVQNDLASTLKDDGIVIDSISVKGISVDEATQRSLERVVTANNDIERAKAERERAKIDAETASLRQKGGSLTGPALARYCLEVMNNWDVAKNGNLPATFNCLGSNPANVLVDGTTPR